LRNKLKEEGVEFHTSCDTEVLVEGYRIWGDDLWPKLNGFWAVVIYDRRHKTITFSRDRIGTAPLYYRNTQDGLFFASNIRSLLDVSPNNSQLNRDAIIGFLQTGIKDHDNSTFYEDIHSFPAGSFTKLTADSCKFNEKDIHRFWDFPKKRLTESDVSFKDAVKTFKEYFFKSVELRLRSDVKVAFELSGGMDSSCIVAAAATMRAGRITAYTAKIKGTDDEPFARTMKQKYDIDYHVIEEFEDNFINDYEEFHKVLEEPFDSPNAYTHHHMLKQMKREGVHVVVTGTGGDEVFAGYERSFWPGAYQDLKKQGFKQYLQADCYEFCRRFMTSQNPCLTLQHHFFDGLCSFGSAAKSAPNGPFLPDTTAYRYLKRYEKMNFQERTLYHFHTASVPYHMRNSDHLTMNIPIEHRFPLLDYNMIEIGLQLPISYLFKNGWTKYLIRKAMEPYLPYEIVWRKKRTGFTFPITLFLKLHRNSLEPLLKNLQKLDIAENAFGSYSELLKNSPQQLWRLLSVAIWLKNL
jgi:asparagine synthase (glutamine-hydrolysing)